ncbi:hypothetical protein LS48_01340 [Aequorivita aquimaris]|uniref:Uncharacterized protein n=1 Tax=Aequorivita aquimaris TaxID=1548749 RepID=A0A137RLV0_9FLAO|nr:hypothetical protein LS48_01340 [Aequorivita aquimaris]
MILPAPIPATAKWGGWALATTVSSFAEASEVELWRKLFWEGNLIAECERLGEEEFDRRIIFMEVWKLGCGTNVSGLGYFT